MEFTRSSQDLKESPSQEDNGYTHPMKLDVESMDDFEHITKEVSPSKEATAQFLQHETMYATNQNRDRDPFEIDDVTENSEIIEDESQGLPQSNSNNTASESASQKNSMYSPDVLVSSSEPALEEDDVGLSKNFMQYEKMNETNQGHDLLTKEMTSNEDKLIDFDATPAYDESPVKSGETILTKNSEIIMLDNSDSTNTPPSSTSQSLPGIIKNENYGDAPSGKLQQGDGIHVRNSSGFDTSDNEEFIPEPVPKDYPEIGVMEPKYFLSAIGIAYAFWMVVFIPLVSICPCESDMSNSSEADSDKECFPLVRRSRGMIEGHIDLFPTPPKALEELNDGHGKSFGSESSSRRNDFVKKKTNQRIKQ